MRVDVSEGRHPYAFQPSIIASLLEIQFNYRKVGTFPVCFVSSGLAVRETGTSRMEYNEALGGVERF